MENQQQPELFNTKPTTENKSNDKKVVIALAVENIDPEKLTLSYAIQQHMSKMGFK